MSDYVYSADFYGEQFYKMSVDDAKRDAIENGYSFYWRGKETPVLMDTLIDVYWVEIHMQEQLADLMGDAADGFALTLEAKDALNSMLKTWAEKYAGLDDYWYVADAEKIALKDTTK